MLDQIMSEFPVDIRKFDKSPEAKRLLESAHQNLKAAMADPESSIGLTINAILVQLTERDSILMNEADFTFQERMLISMTINKLWSKLK